MPEFSEEVMRALAEVRDAVRRNGEEVKALRQELAGVEATKNQRVPPFAPPTPDEQLVTLDQIAARMRMSKRSLERYKKEMPPAVMRGRRGRTARWVWATIRPWLEETFGCQLPERFPAW